MRFCQPDLHPRSWFPFVISSEVTHSVLPHVDSLIHHADHAGDYPSVGVATDPSCSWISYRLSIPWNERTGLAWQGASLYE
jgi:hypothetical protein